MLITSDPSVTNTADYRRLLYQQLCGIKLANWELVGPHLGLNRADLNIIKSNRCGHSNQIQHCISDMFNPYRTVTVNLPSKSGMFEELY